jgi:hypothetical protein
LWHGAVSSARIPRPAPVMKAAPACLETGWCLSNEGRRRVFGVGSLASAKLASDY